jgi:hypothetical protein
VAAALLVGAPVVLMTLLFAVAVPGLGLRWVGGQTLFALVVAIVASREQHRQWVTRRVLLAALGDGEIDRVLAAGAKGTDAGDPAARRRALALHDLVVAQSRWAYRIMYAVAAPAVAYVLWSVVGSVTETAVWVVVVAGAGLSWRPWQRRRERLLELVEQDERLAAARLAAPVTSTQ